MAIENTDFYELDSLLTDEEKMVRDNLRRFLAKEIKTHIIKAFDEEKPIDMKNLAPRLGELGVIGPFIPRTYGCSGSTYTTFGLICQEMERVDSALRSFIAVESGLVMYPIWQYGSEKQKKKWLPLLAGGKVIGCFGLTEPNHGSDAASIETTAKKDGNQWVLNGSKQWISEAATADLAIVWAKHEGIIRGYIVERGTEGFEQNLQKRKGSMRAGDVGSLFFSDCRISEDAILPSCRGLKAPLSCLNQARYGISWGAIGLAMDCYETAINYTKERIQFGKPIASYQLVQEKLVNMLIEITKGQLLSYRLGKLMDLNRASAVKISMAKKNNVSMARMCARTARELLGANGISLDNSPIRHMANIESVYTYEGTDDMHTLIIGQFITGLSAFS